MQLSNWGKVVKSDLYYKHVVCLVGAEITALTEAEIKEQGRNDDGISWQQRGFE